MNEWLQDHILKISHVDQLCIFSYNFFGAFDLDQGYQQCYLWQGFTSGDRKSYKVQDLIVCYIFLFS